MKKEMSIAIIIGFVFGGIAALTLINLPNVIKNSSLSKATVTPSPTPIITPISQPNYKIELISPKDQSVIQDEIVEISGKGKSDSLFLIETESDTKLALSDKEGLFKEKVNLADGQNNVYITSFMENGEFENYNLTLYYTGEKL